MRLLIPLVIARFSAFAFAGEVPHLTLTRGDQPACRIVVTVESPEERLVDMAVQAIAGPVKRWSGVELPVLRLGPDASSEQGRDALAAPSIVLATLDQLQRWEPALVREHDALLRLESMDEQAYVCVPVERPDSRLLIVSGRSARAVYNGAVYLGEDAIDGTAGDISVETEERVRSPQLTKRPMYVLTIWGEEDEYSTEDWMKMFETFARDGITDIYFWLSGHFPSQAFPQTCKLKDKDWDSTTDSRIATLADQRRLIDRAHELGMRFFLGGGLGAWCGTFMLTDRDPQTLRRGSKDESGQDVSEWALCPSSDRARDALVAYYREMFDSLPQADGLYIESADEFGECTCERCRVPVDDLGSRMFGQSQLSLIQRLMHEVWKEHPHARLAYTIGYTPHRRDPAYYEVVRQMSADSRIEWMEARDSWSFPGPTAEPLPPAYFSPRVLRWEYCEKKTLDQLVQNSWRAATSGFGGWIATFSPGFDSGSFYHQVPLPTDGLPYVLTHFVYREAAWSPTASVEEMKRRVGRRFFGRDAQAEWVERLWSLRELMRETAGRKIRPAQLERLAQIEAIAAGHDGASPKAREGLDLMARAASDIRQMCKVVASQPG